MNPMYFYQYENLYKVKKYDYQKVGDKGAEKDIQILRERQKNHIKLGEIPELQNLKELEVFDAMKQQTMIGIKDCFL